MRFRRSGSEDVLAGVLALSIGALIAGLLYFIKFTVLMYVWNHCLIDLFTFVKMPMTWAHVIYLAIFMMFWQVEPGKGGGE